MCGFFFVYSKKKIREQDRVKYRKNALKYLHNRGPDGSGEDYGNNYFAFHTRLAITGDRSQPITKNNLVILYNGEIYNDWKKYSDNYSDADFLSNFIVKNSSKNFGNLDGEYAIVIYDKLRNTLKLLSDPFATKPMYWAVSNNTFMVSSYDQTLKDLKINEKKINQIRPNSCITFNFSKNFTKKIKFPVKKFYFNPKKKSTYKDFSKSFELAIKKRTMNTSKKIFVPLSSGHDSGLIAAILDNLKVAFTSYYVKYGEDKKILDKRLFYLKTNKKIKINEVKVTDKLAKKERKFLKKKAPYFNVNTHYRPYFSDDFRDIPGMIALSLICKLSRKDKNLIQLSGQGADEIISDYYHPSTNSKRSTIKGNWSNVRKPWPNFYGRWNKINLGVTERIAGANGIETRYPFLDYNVVQSYLFLPAELKSIAYKAPINFMLKKFNFPSSYIKQGFAGFKSSRNHSKKYKKNGKI